jgi:hypothetical protein
MKTVGANIVAEGTPVRRLDDDLQEVIDRFNLVHDMWMKKERARFEVHQADVDCTPFDEEDLRAVEHGFRVAVVRAEVVIRERKELHGKWSTARRFHWRHEQDIDAMWEADEEKLGEVDSPLGERIYNCECETLARKIKRHDKRLARLGRMIALIRHALYIRGQYRSRIEVAEWTGPQIRKMVADITLPRCECEDCVKAGQELIKRGKLGRGWYKKYVLSITEPYSMRQQLKDQELAEKAKKGGTGAGFAVNGQKAVVFGTNVSVGFLFGK